MNFNDLDQRMRKYEQSLDQVLHSDLYLVAHLDGRNFTRLTKEICSFEAPFDIKFRDIMLDTVRALMDCGFRVIYGFTQSDEISLLFHPREDAFGRRVRKYNSTLAGVASAAFSLKLGQLAVFDCRMVPLPSIETVQDYFLWRQEDAHRNALNSHCYWMLRKEGASVQSATEQLVGKSVSYKKNLLLQHGIDFASLPSWQKFGVGIWRANVAREGFNPVTKETAVTQRRALYTEFELPQRKKYAEWISDLLTAEQK